MATRSLNVDSSSISDSNNDSNSDWGWENIVESHADEGMSPAESDTKVIDQIKPVKSLKSFDSKQIALKVAADSLKSGMTSSPSFQELEKAIGATLALSMNGSENENSYNHGRGMPIHKIESFNSIYQRAQNIQTMTRQKSSNASKSVREELSEFIREAESRAIILFHSPDTQPNVIRDACQKIGALYYIRPDFRNRGVTFLSYSDLRSAVSAVINLAKDLGPTAAASAHYSIMLHGTTNNAEEHRLMVKNLPSTIVETELESVFSRYGEVRSIERKQTVDSEGRSLSESSYIYFVEYFNINDSRSAVSELCATSSQIWGPSTQINFCPLTQHKQSLLRQLLSILSRWRSESTPVQSVPSYNRISNFYPPVVPAAFSTSSYGFSNSGASMEQNLDLNMMNSSNSYNASNYVLRNGIPFFSGSPYSHELMSKLPESVAFSRSQYQSMPPYPSNITSSSNSSAYRSSISSNSSHSSELEANLFMPNTQSLAVKRGLSHSAPHSSLPHQPPQYRVADSRPQHHNGGSQSHSIRRSRLQSAPIADSEFTLDLSRIENRFETRTTVMVRNIPNKYTQRMLLDEVDINHKGTYDFFYLPIDFKNRCNVGYCFINFLDPGFIVGFVEEFNGHRWKNFNSEKVCAVTFARIQGKSAMISRFQNSSLLEKNDEYKPLLFYSSGPERGKSEPFPAGGRHKPHVSMKESYGYHGAPYHEQLDSSEVYEDDL